MYIREKRWFESRGVVAPLVAVFFYILQSNGIMLVPGVEEATIEFLMTTGILVGIFSGIVGRCTANKKLRFH